MALSSLGQSKQEFSVAGSHSYNRSSPLRWILSHLRRYPLLVIAFISAVTLTAIIFSGIPRLIGLAFDEMLKADPSLQRLLVIAGTILGLVLLRGLIDLTNAVSVETLGQRLERDSREELYLSLLGKSQTFHNRQKVGDIMARAANDVRQLNPMMNPGVSLLTESMVGIIVPLTFIAFIKLDLLLAPLLFIVTFVLALRYYMRQLNPVSGNMRRQFGILNAGLNETITGIEVVKSSVQEGQEQQKFVKNASLFRDYFVRQGLVQARYLPLLFLGIASTGAFAHGLWLFSKGQLSVGELVAYMGLMGALRFPAFISIFTFSLVQLGMAGAERMLELMRSETELDENPSGHSAPIKGDLVFDHVNFSYSGKLSDKLILKDFSFHARPGETVAIVGQTGSGKSTLTNLVNRIYDATEGQILVDGVDVKNWNLETLRSQISVIEQDIFLFSRSIADNISFGLGQVASREAVEAAAKAAQAHDFILGFEDGYDTVIGERGVTLSGGQRQRLAIARALLTDPRILILDDSTSAIDSATEDEIQKAINKVLEGRTTLMITHRLSQIRRADKILVLHQGELIDQGKHEDLLRRCSLYQRIFARYD
ncbi:MAG: ABC transporter ATP-binding protein [Trueperaceae bacterium]|nr:ABC transporter ATP-binding protein [Trueperaceae bacterium]